MNEDIIWVEKNLTDRHPNLLKNAGKDSENIIIETKTASIKKLWKDIGIKSGIYKIINKIDGKYYVGSSEHIYRRFYNHLLWLKRNSHHSGKLQNAWNKCGELNFILVIIEETSINELLSVEQQYLDIAKTEKEMCYNVSFDSIASMRGRKHSEETKRLMSLSHKGDKSHWFGKHKTNEEKTSLYRDINGLMRDSQFKLTLTYFILFPDNELIKIYPNRRSFINLFPEQKKIVRRLLRRNSINLKREEDMVKAVSLVEKELQDYLIVTH